MNYRMIKNTLGWLLMFEAGFFLVPLATAIVYEEWRGAFAFILSMVITAVAACLLIFIGKPHSKQLYNKDGFVIVALSWIALSIFGSLPFLLAGLEGSVATFTGALFETASGFTTTGSSVIENVDLMPKCILMWRSFTHWVGGMGVLVFMMAFLPIGGARNMHIMQAESPGPSVSKLVPKVRTTALILYSIYFVLTVVEFAVYMLCGMTPFEALNTAFAVAGTGGFSFRSSGMMDFPIYTQVAVTVFMLVFSINFGSYYLLLKGKFKESFNSEVRAFLLIVLVAISAITLSVTVADLEMFRGKSFGYIVNHVSFSVASIISTTGFGTVDFNLWPEFSKAIIIIIMIIGACAGSTGGGLKVSRIILWFKGVIREIGAILHPKQVKKISIDGKPVEHEVVRSVNAYIVCYILLFAGSFIILTLDKYDLVTDFSAVATTLGNVGPGLGAVGPTGNFAGYSHLSKLVMTFNMLAGRLELFPMLILFNPNTYKR